MHSSISNFSWGAFKALCGAAVTIAAAWILVPAHMPSDLVLPISAQSTNQFVLERYANLYRTKRVVIVGSSITTAIPSAACEPDNVISIPLQGRGGVTGLEAIIRTGAVPDIVFAEVPSLINALDESLINEVFSPVYWKVRSWIPPLQYFRNWIVLFYQRRAWNIRPFEGAIKFPNETVEDWERARATQFASGLQEKRNDQAIAIVTPQIVSRIRALKEKGIRIIFFDPVDSRLRNQSPNKDLRAQLRSELPDVPIIDAPDDTIAFYRDDAQHLNIATGVYLFNYLMDYANIKFTPKCQLMPERPLYGPRISSAR